MNIFFDKGHLSFLQQGVHNANSAKMSTKYANFSSHFALYIFRNLLHTKELSYLSSELENAVKKFVSRKPVDCCVVANHFIVSTHSIKQQT